ncbi:acetyltransferase [Tsukamurella serpentis]
MAGPGDRRIEPLSARTLRPSFSVMARAFADDPLLRWIQPVRLTDRLTFAGTYLASHGAVGCSDVLFDGALMTGAAYWDPPGYTPSVLRRLAAIPVLAAGVSTGLRRGAVFARAVAERRPTEPHWYLSSLGATTPGRGIGSALLEHGIERLTGPAYLESSNPRNVPLYRRFGFEPLAPILLPGGPELIPMFRPAG